MSYQKRFCELRRKRTSKFGNLGGVYATIYCYDDAIRPICNHKYPPRWEWLRESELILQMHL